MKIRVTKNLLIKALGKLSLSDEEKNRLLEYISTAKTGFAEIETQRFSAALMSYILKNSPNMASKAKAQLSIQLFNESSIEEDDKFEVWNTPIKQLADIVECFSRIGTKQPNADVLFNKTWFPVVVIPSFSPGSRYSDACVTFAIKVTFAKEYVDIGFTVVRKHLLNNRGGIRKISLKELLREFGCRPLQCDLIQHEGKLTQTNALLKQNVQLLCYGYVISDLKNNRSEMLGYKSAKERVIIESELEYDISRTRQAEVFDEDWWPLPFLRVFSFFLKRYVFVNVV